MSLEQGDIITLKGQEYLILDDILIESVEYALGNRITEEEEPTNEFWIFKVMNKGEDVIRVTNKDELDKVLPLFSKNLQDLVNQTIGEYTGVIK